MYSVQIIETNSALNFRRRTNVRQMQRNMEINMSPNYKKDKMGGDRETRD